MYYDPDTIWGRTVQGDHEIATPTSGLSLVQRRVLQQLAQPRTFATLAARHHFDAPKLEHELIRLAELKLVAYQRPGTTQPRTAPRIDLPLPANSAQMADPWRPPMPVYYFAAAALGIATVLLLMT